MKMKDWAEKLNAFLKFNEQDILIDKGGISHEVAVALAEKEYELFRIEQDRKYISDFDKLVDKTKKLEKGISPKKKGKTKN